jgi:hypothetical protein
MRPSQLLSLAVNLIGIAPLTWTIRRLAERHVRKRSSEFPATTSNTVTIEIHSAGHQHGTSVTASVTFPAVQQHAAYSTLTKVGLAAPDS